MKIPSVGFGTYQIKGQECSMAVQEAILTGYRMIDTASIYKNENEIGETLATLFKEKKIDRLWCK